MSVFISTLDYLVPYLTTQGVYISCLEYKVPIIDPQGGVTISWADYDSANNINTIDPSYYKDLDMATNFYFNNFNDSKEQGLYDDLVVETIQIHGQDMFYLPRTVVVKDKLYGAGPLSEFNRAFPIEMYIRSIEGFAGGGTTLGVGGFSIADTVQFTVSRTVFKLLVGNEANLVRPREGDLIYFPLNRKCFQIQWVDDKPAFYPLGSLPTYELHTELYEYSHEQFNTGIEEIDSIMGLSNDILDYALMTEAGELLMTEAGDYLVTNKFDLEVIDPLVDTDTLQEEADVFVDFSESDPFSVPTY